jgi:hypothetical protein
MSNCKINAQSLELPFLRVVQEYSRPWDTDSRPNAKDIRKDMCPV